MVPCCAGLRLQSVRRLLMQQAAIPPLFHLGIIEPPEKRSSPTSGRIITLTAHAEGLPAAKSVGASQSLPACPASVGTFRAGVRMGYQVAGVLSTIPLGLFKGAVRLFSS
jgi:hypothetical protein